MTTLDTILQPGNHLDGPQETYATGLRQHWLVDNMNTEIRTVMDKHDISAARAVIARYRDALGKDPRVLDFLDHLCSQLDDLERHNQRQRTN
jgi:hypothetical protein